MLELPNTIIVVEGVTDAAFIKSFVDCEVVVTNGISVPRETINYLKHAQLQKQIVILTDPDMPGKKIRARLDKHLESPLHCYIKKENSTKNGKVGVAESSKEEILAALSKLPKQKPSKQGKWKTINLYELGLIGQSDSKVKRIYLGDKLGLGYPNGKLILKRLNSLNVSLDQVREVLKEYENENSEPR